MTRPYQLERQSRYLGKLPEEWAAVPFGRIVSSSQYGLNSLASESGQYAMLRMNNLQDGAINTNDLAYVDLDDEEATKYLLEVGDLLLNRTNSADLVGKTALFEFDKPFVFASYLIRFKINKTKADPRFVNYFLNSEKGEQRLKAFSTKGASQVNLNPTTLKSHYYFPLPPLPEQRKIAAILSTWDRAIEFTEKLIAAKERRKQALMQRLLTGKVRFPGFTEPWREVRLDSLIDKAKGNSVETNEDQNGIPYIGSVEFAGKYTRYTIDERAVKCNGEDVLLLWDGEYAGKSTTSHEGAVGSTVMRLRIRSQIKPTFLDSHFLYYNQRIRNIREGSGIPHVPGDFLHWYPITLPSIEEQEKIGQALERADREVASLEELIAQQQEQKKGLMQQLLTGKTRVKVEEEG